MSEDADTLTAERMQRRSRIIATWPMTWIRRTGLALAGLGVLIAVFAHPFSTATWSWQTLGFLVLVLGLVVNQGTPGALELMGHPWAAPTLKALQWYYKHPRLLVLTQVWAGLVGLGWVSILLFLHLPGTIPPILPPMLCVGLVPYVAISLADRRR